MKLRVMFIDGSEATFADADWTDWEWDDSFLRVFHSSHPNTAMGEFVISQVRGILQEEE